MSRTSVAEVFFMEKTPVKESRIETRIPSDLKKRLARAAALEGRTLSDFVVSAAAEAARRTIEENALLRLCEEDSRAPALDLCPPRKRALSAVARGGCPQRCGKPTEMS